MNELLLGIGIDIKIVIAGFAGGVVHTFFFKQVDPYTVVGSIVSGAFTANYLAEILAKLSGYSVGACGFIAGFGSMALIQGIVSVVKLKMGVKNGT